MRTLICIATLLAFMSAASAHGGGFHGGGGHMGGGGFHGGGGVHEGFHGGGGGHFGHRGFGGGFARPGGGLFIGGVWCPWPAYYAGECSPD